MGIFQQAGGRKFVLTVFLQSVFVLLLLGDHIDAGQYATLVPMIAGMYMGANYALHREERIKSQKQEP